jgi:hypothetical protein
MSGLDDAIEALYAALGTVDGLRVVRGVGLRVDPPAVLVAPPRLVWNGFGPDPTDATFTVPVVVAQDDRAMSEVLKWGAVVWQALNDVENAAVRSADPGTWPAGGGSELPAYLIDVEMGLL